MKMLAKCAIIVDMNKTIRSFLFWTPRILGILFILFMSIFSLDVFENGGDVWSMLAGFLIHNIPTIILILVIVIGWRWEWVGAAGFLAIAAWLLSVMAGNDIRGMLIMIGTPVLVAILFLIGWLGRNKIRA